MTSPDSSAQPDAALTFADLGLPQPLVDAVRDLGYETPSPIQAATIPALLAGGDLVGQAQTGTGKTAAYALPVLADLDPKQRTPQTLVLAPTRELALQVCEAFEQYAAHLEGVSVLPVYGGQSYSVQLSALRRGVQIVVGTPGRIMDHLSRGTLDLSALRHLVLDEADEMLQMGFVEDVETVLASTPESKQVALFSATMPAQIRRISKNYLRDPQEITVKSTTTTAKNITQRYVLVSYQQKVDALTRFLEVEAFDAMIVFVRTKHETETVAEKLRARGFSAAAINGDVPQAQRERTVAQLKNGQLDILVATDVAARGLDVERISHVVNYDIPTDTESYVHRIGRTGRAGRSGDAISFVTPRERHLLRAIEKATHQPLTQVPLPTADEINVTRLTRFDDAITQALERTAEIDQLRDVVSHYVRHHDVPEVDVAAALALVGQGERPLLLDAEAEQRAAAEQAQHKDARRERGDRRENSNARFTTYRIAVGRRQKVQPGHIVGAFANEGGLSRNDFGAIQIHPDFSLVELPNNLDAATLDRLGRVRISGQLTEIRPDTRGGIRADRRGPAHPHRDHDRAHDDRPRKSKKDRDKGDWKPKRDHNDKGDWKPKKDRDKGDWKPKRDHNDKGDWKPKKERKGGSDARPFRKPRHKKD
ncbi:DEAD/DEAH box helicase [Pseudoclavibacter soli]|uniref:DEAD/DEAH box helicase n=1 Tax=Pseudoclavibacter soli TaxID=452623 RepID=UPI00042A7F1A|nr:DEAD/DEAH box helicase [Pseudoclavibacter soli]